MAITNEFVCESANSTNTWRRVAGNGLKGERFTKIAYTNDTRLESYSIFTPATSQELYRRDRLYWTLQGNDLLVSETIDPAGLSLLTTNTYDSVGRLLLTLRPDGSWERREYDAAGWPIRTVRPLTNQPPTASTNECRVTEYSYATVSGSPDNSPQIGQPRTIWELVAGQVVSKTMRAFPSENEIETRVAASASAGWTDSGNESSYVKYDTEHRITQANNPDGTYTTYTYTANSTGRLTTTRFHDGAASEIRRVEEQFDTLSRPVSRREIDVASGILIDQELWSDPDEFLRPTKVTYLDASTTVSIRQGCCNLAYSIDRDGIATTNSYDALKRMVASTRLGITISNVLDAADRLRSQTRKGTSGSAMTIRSLGYDAANRVIRETNALGTGTSQSYSVDANFQSVTITTNADGGTRIETHFRDGNIASITGTAAFPVRYVYGVTNEGGVQRAYALQIKLDAGGNDTPEWEQTFTDGVGRAYKTVYAGPGAPYRQSFYNFKGQQWKVRDPDGVVTLYTNNLRGELEYTCIDSNRNDVIDLGGQDRVTQTVSDVVGAHGTNVLRTRTYVWETDGNSSGTLISTSERSVEGLKSWQETLGVISSSIKTLPSAGAYTVTQTDPNASYSISLFQSGRITSVTRYDSNGVQVAKTTFGYDSHGRRNTSTDARNGTMTYTFNNADQVTGVTTPPPGTVGGNAQTSTSLLDAMGRATNVVQADGTSVGNVFSLRGELLRTSGTRTYPVGYAYDAQGRMKHMTNWSGFSAGAGARVTTWHYDASRGWLTNKVYDDGKGTKYTYTDAGRLSTRLWARGTNTTYAYNNFGDLQSVSYNDGVTPTVTYTYDRLGRHRTVTRGSDAWKLFHDTAGRLLSEAGTAGTLNGLRVTNNFDGWGRRTTVAALNGGSSLTSHDYGYDSAGRLNSATDGSYSATYSYIANSPLVGQILFKQSGTTRMTTTKQYDGLNRLSSIVSEPSAAGAATVAYAYSYNDANQRTRVNLGDGSFWIYQYDALGQVTSGKRYWSDWTPVAGQQFEYGFDDIGNRTGTKAGGDQNGGGLRSASYTANSVNQLTQREVPPYLNVIGVATATATNVNVNNTLAYRKGEYFRVELNPDNSTAAVWQSVTNRAVQNGNTNSATGNLFLPGTPEVFGYDADGNLTNDGRWAYVWDGENRLLSVTSKPFSPSGSSNAIHFKYDAQGRRISKMVSNFAGGSWSKVLDEKYLYDGWNLVGVLNATNTALLKSFLWGSDLSGSLQRAGGVGGLIAMNVAGGSVYFAAFDGNGNVAALVHGTDGTVAAVYEYGPFGEPVRSSGAIARTNPFRFSTKFHDEESDLIGYGYRYYSVSLGRWLGRDPIGELGFSVVHERRNSQRKLTANPYSFVENNSVSFIDPDGLESVFIRLETEIRPPDPEAGTKSWHYVEINEYGKILSQQSFIGTTEIPFPVQGSGTLGVMVSGTHPNFTVKFTGSVVSVFVYPGSIALSLGPAVLGSQLRIDYDVPVTINFCTHTGAVGGSHDGYPSYMVFVKSKKVYDFPQTTTTVGPINLGILNLLPPMDVTPSVSFTW